jgi:hypothetical protein
MRIGKTDFDERLVGVAEAPSVDDLPVSHHVQLRVSLVYVDPRRYYDPAP